MTDITSLNKAVVRRFNEEFLARGDEAVLDELFDPAFVNRTAMPGMDPGIEGMRLVVKKLLHGALSEIRVEIDDQLAEGDRVATRKRILGRHTGDLLGAAATGREIQIAVFDIVRLRGERYLEHWGLNTIPLVAQQLKAGAR